MGTLIRQIGAGLVGGAAISWLLGIAPGIFLAASMLLYLAGIVVEAAQEQGDRPSDAGEED